jgi:hypothetical protein
MMEMRIELFHEISTGDLYDIYIYIYTHVSVCLSVCVRVCARSREGNLEVKGG